MNRRSFFLSAALLPLTARLAHSSDFPKRNIKVVVPFDVGGTVDPVMRLLAEQLSRRAGSSLVVENKGGAGGTIGATAVAREKADGYTLLGASNAMSVAEAMFKTLPWSVSNDFKFIANIGEVPLAILANNEQVLAKTIPELVAVAKEKPGVLTYGSAGVGSTAHLAGEMFCLAAGIEMTHVPFKGAGPASAGLMSGAVDLLFAGATAAGPVVDSGRGRMLAVTGKSRAPQMPDVPAVSESFEGYTVSTWLGLAGPAGLPADIAATIALWIQDSLADEAFAERLKGLGVVPEYLDGEGVAALAAREVADFRQIIASAGIAQI